MAVGSPEFADDVAQGADPRGLRAVPGCARSAGRRVVARPRGLRQDEERDRAQVAVLHHATQDGRRVEIGEVEVEQHELRARRVGERRLPAAGTPAPPRPFRRRGSRIAASRAREPAAPRGRTAGCRRPGAPAPGRCRPLEVRAAADSRYVRARPTGGAGAAAPSSSPSCAEPASRSAARAGRVPSGHPVRQSE